MLVVYEREGVLCAEGTIEKFGRKVFVYLVDGMLIDTGPEALKQDLTSFINGNQFDSVAFTHNHEDHTGNAAWITENFNVPLYMHPHGIELCRTAGEYPVYRQLIWGQRQAFQAQPLQDNIHSKNLEWQVIFTPGHAGDHVSFLHEETGRLFSGDLFVSPKTKVMMATESVKQLMDSIQKLLQYNFTHLYCSHAGYFANGREMLEMKLGNLEKMSAAILELDSKGFSIEEINAELFRGDYPIVKRSGGEWDTLHTIRSVLNELKITS